MIILTLLEASMIGWVLTHKNASKFLKKKSFHCCCCFFCQRYLQSLVLNCPQATTTTQFVQSRMKTEPLTKEWHWKWHVVPPWLGRWRSCSWCSRRRWQCCSSQRGRCASCCSSLSGTVGRWLRQASFQSRHRLTWSWKSCGSSTLKQDSTHIHWQGSNLSIVNWLRSNVCLATSQEYCLGSSSSSSLLPPMNRRQGKETWWGRKEFLEFLIWSSHQLSPCIPCFCQQQSPLTLVAESNFHKHQWPHLFKRGLTMLSWRPLGCGHRGKGSLRPASFPHKDGKAGWYIAAR